MSLIERKLKLKTLQEILKMLIHNFNQETLIAEYTPELDESRRNL